MSKEKISFAVIGCGTVGSEVIRQFLAKKDSELFSSFELKYVCEKYPKKEYNFPFPFDILCEDAQTAINDPEIKFIIELIGGINPAKEIIIDALKKGKHVITANKALLAEEGNEVFAEAHKAKRMIRYEAAVGGGMPVIRALQENLSADEVVSFEGILNATTNYILTRVNNFHETIKDSIKEAQKLGLAEQDPSKDVEGIDAAHKLALLATTIDGCVPPFWSIKYKGIMDITELDFQVAEKLGFTIKLIAKYVKNEILRVEPLMIPASNPLYSVDYELNGINFNCENLGNIFISGAGGGGKPTAVSVLSDILQIEKDIQLGSYIPALKSCKLMDNINFPNNYCIYKAGKDISFATSLPLKQKGVFKIENKEYAVAITEKISDNELSKFSEVHTDLKVISIELEKGDIS
ncbi:MAG: homoserine dehydrogenase [Armatimonadota bacterium]